MISVRAYVIYEGVIPLGQRETNRRVLGRVYVTKSSKVSLMATPSSTFYKRKTFPSTKQFACVKAKRQPRNSELPYSKDPVISTNLSQPSRHTYRERCSHHKPSVPVAEPSHTQQGAHNVLRIMYPVTIARK